MKITVNTEAIRFDFTNNEEAAKKHRTTNLTIPRGEIVKLTLDKDVPNNKDIFAIVLKDDKAICDEFSNVENVNAIDTFADNLAVIDAIDAALYDL